MSPFYSAKYMNKKMILKIINSKMQRFKTYLFLNRNINASVRMLKWFWDKTIIVLSITLDINGE